MKKLLTLFMLLFGIISTNQAQHSIGFITGTTPIYDVFGQGSDNFVFQLDPDFLNAFRYGVRGQIQLSELQSVQVGVDRYNQDFRLQIDSNFGFIYHNYDLSYAQILSLGSIDFHLPDTYNGWTPFLGAKYGLSIDILLQETKNDIIQTQTDFNKIILNGVAGSFIGIQKGHLKLTGICNMQVSANSIINPDIIGSTRQYDISLLIYAGVIF